MISLGLAEHDLYDREQREYEQRDEYHRRDDEMHRVKRRAFVVDATLPGDINTFTLSYTFFEVAGKS